MTSARDFARGVNPDHPAYCPPPAGQLKVSHKRKPNHVPLSIAISGRPSVKVSPSVLGRLAQQHIQKRRSG